MKLGGNEIVCIYIYIYLYVGVCVYVYINVYAHAHMWSGETAKCLQTSGAHECCKDTHLCVCKDVSLRVYVYVFVYRYAFINI